MQIGDFEQTSGVFIANDLILLDPSKTKILSHSAICRPWQIETQQSAILGRWKELFKDLLNLVTTTPPDTNEVHLEEENKNRWSGIPPSCQNTESRKATGCDEIRPEMLTSLLSI